MAKKRLTEDRWGTARIRWETETDCTFTVIAELLGVSKQAVAQQAKLRGWKRHVENNQPQNLITEIGRKQSATIAENPQSQSPHATKVVSENFRSRIHKDPFTNQSLREKEQAMVEVRALILKRHRDEWAAARNLLYRAIQSNDIDLSRVAKNVADTMKRVQEGEREAWGLGSASDQSRLQIIIERHPGSRIVK